MKLVPDRKKFMEIIGTGDIGSDVEKFCDGFSSVLAENHKFLVTFFYHTLSLYDPNHIKFTIGNCLAPFYNYRSYLMLSFCSYIAG